MRPDMRRSFAILLFLSTLLAPKPTLGQGESVPLTPLPSGIGIKAGYGNYAFTDEYFSTERYSGTLPLFSLTWAHFRESGGYAIGMEWRRSSGVKNHNISAGVTSFSLDLEYLYRVTTLRLLSREAPLFLGPSTGLFLHLSELNIAFSELELPYSFAILIPLGVRSTLVLPVTNRIHLVGSLGASILSLGIRMFDVEEEVNEQTPVRLLPLTSGTRGNFSLEGRYRVASRLSLNLGYDFQFLRVKPWDPLLTASDNLFCGFSVIL